MALYRRADFDNFDIFSTALCAVFASYPASIGRQTIDPVKGLPSKLKFPPSIAEVKASLDEGIIRRKAIAYRAKILLDEQERRASEVKRADISPERHAELLAQLQALSRKLSLPHAIKPRTMDSAA